MNTESYYDYQTGILVGNQIVNQMNSTEPIKDTFIIRGFIKIKDCSLFIKGLQNVFLDLDECSYSCLIDDISVSQSIEFDITYITLKPILK